MNPQWEKRFTLYDILTYLSTFEIHKYLFTTRISSHLNDTQTLNNLVRGCISPYIAYHVFSNTITCALDHIVSLTLLSVH